MTVVNLIFIFGAKYLSLLVILFAFFWFLNQPRVRKKESLILICICLPLIFVAAVVASHIYYNPRPFVAQQVKSLIAHKPDNGFPSHHVLLVSSLSAIIFIFSKRLGFFLWALTLLVGFSRVYVGVHHVSDIVGSILISVSIVSLTYFLYPKRGKPYAEK